MIFNDIGVANQQNRSIAMLSLQSIRSAISQANVQLTFMNRYLFGITGSEGICTILANYYTEVFQWTGRTSQKPGNIADSTTWGYKLAYACSAFGDQYFESSVTADMLYPPNGSGVPVPTMSRGCTWLSNSKDSGNPFSASSVYGCANSLAVSIGTPATIGLNRGSVSYGTGLRGARACDNEGAGGAGPYGSGAADLPHYYNDGTMPIPNNLNPSTNNRSGVINGLSALIAALNSILTPLNTQIAVLQKIQANTNVLFVEANMTADAPLSDIAAMQAQVTAINGWLTTLGTYSTYFNSFTASNDISGQAGYVASTFDANLIALQTLCGTITSAALARSNAVTVAMSNTAPGTEPTTGLRKWLVFWVSQLANKPASPYYSLIGLSNSAPFSVVNAGNNAEVFAITNLSNSKKSLDTVIGTPTSYLEKPIMNAAYNNPVMDNIAKTVLSQRVSVVFNGVLASNRHSIFRHDITTVWPTDNSAWVEASYADVIQADVGSGFTRLFFDDTSVVLGHLYVYRVQSFDTSVSPFVASRLDSYDTSSLQSDIFTANVVSATSVTGNVVTTGAHNLVSGQMVALSSTGKFYKVGDVSPTQFTLIGPTIPNSVVAFSVTVLAGVIQL
jgi:hypothetical protein